MRFDLFCVQNKKLTLKKCVEHKLLAWTQPRSPSFSEMEEPFRAVCVPGRQFFITVLKNVHVYFNE